MMVTGNSYRIKICEIDYGEKQMMKKRMLLLFLVVGMIAAGCGKEEMSETPEIQSSEKADTESEEIEDEAETTREEAVESEEEILSFSEFENLEFYFASGAGGWRTVMQIKEDGSFSGQYSDSDMGSSGDEYPNGTYYFCAFEGKFTQPVKVNDYTYSMEIEEISLANEAGTEEIIDDTLYSYSEPYGLDGAEEVLIYLPGAPTTELPAEYMSWVRNDMENPDVTQLPFYGLYNVTEQNGFSSYDISGRIDDMMAATEEWALTVRASLENDGLTQADMNEKSKELYDIWDAALNTLWTELKEQLPEDEFQVLLDDQRLWIADKEQAVKDAGAEVEGGSLYPLVVNMKAAEMTEERVYELYELLK